MTNVHASAHAKDEAHQFDSVNSPEAALTSIEALSCAGVTHLEVSFTWITPDEMLGSASRIAREHLRLSFRWQSPRRGGLDS